MDEKKTQNLSHFFGLYPEIKLVYLFGSKATGREVPLSDYDFAIYIDKKSRKEISELKVAWLTKFQKFQERMP